MTSIQSFEPTQIKFRQPLTLQTSCLSSAVKFLFSHSQFLKHLDNNSKSCNQHFCLISFVYTCFVQATKLESIDISKLYTKLLSIYRSSDKYTFDSEDCDPFDFISAILTSFHLKAMNKHCDSADDQDLIGNCGGKCALHQIFYLGVDEAYQCGCGKSDTNSWDPLTCCQYFNSSGLLDDIDRELSDNLMKMPGFYLKKGKYQANSDLRNSILSDCLKKRLIAAEADTCIDENCSILHSTISFKVTNYPELYILNVSWESCTHLDAFLSTISISTQIFLDDLYSSRRTKPYRLKGILFAGRGRFDYAELKGSTWIFNGLGEDSDWYDLLKEITVMNLRPVLIIYERIAVEQRKDQGFEIWKFQLIEKLAVECDEFEKLNGVSAIDEGRETSGFNYDKKNVEGDRRRGEREKSPEKYVKEYKEIIIEPRIMKIENNEKVIDPRGMKVENKERVIEPRGSRVEEREMRAQPEFKEVKDFEVPANRNINYFEEVKLEKNKNIQETVIKKRDTYDKSLDNYLKGTTGALIEEFNEYEFLPERRANEKYTENPKESDKMLQNHDLKNQAPDKLKGYADFNEKHSTEVQEEHKIKENLGVWDCKCGVANSDEWEICQKCGSIKPGLDGWVCEKCTARNESNQITCSACQNYKSGDMIINQGFWICSHCMQAVNDMTDVCDCGNYKAKKRFSVEKPTPKTKQENNTGTWTCSHCRALNLDNNVVCKKCKLQKKDIVVNKTRDENTGTWICSFCRALNLDSVFVCKKCKLQKKEIVATKTRNEKANEKWMCGKCNNLNDQYFTWCTTCYKAKDSKIVIEENASALWNCKYCNVKNNRTDGVCSDCSMKNFLPENEPKKNTKEWKCKCGIIQDEWKSYCRACRMDKPCPNETDSRLNWKCTKCLKMNENSTRICGGCFNSKPAAFSSEKQIYIHCDTCKSELKFINCLKCKRLCRYNDKCLHCGSENEAVKICSGCSEKKNLEARRNLYNPTRLY